MAWPTDPDLSPEKPPSLTDRVLIVAYRLIVAVAVVGVLALVLYRGS